MTSQHEVENLDPSVPRQIEVPNLKTDEMAGRIDGNL